MAQNLSLFDLIEDGPDWLEHPDCMQFLRQQGLDDVQVQLVGPRRSFAGKAWPGWSVVRMVSVGVHPVRWLLTFIHELAHIADFRQRVRDLESEWGRPYQAGRRDGRQAWRLDRPHGGRWRAEFVRLAHEAVSAGLFPGNEAVVIAAAQAGATSLDDVLLDLLSDPRVQAEELRLQEEERRDYLQQASLGLEEFKRLFRPGQIVHFDAGTHSGVVTARLVRINRKSCTVEAHGHKWHVPYGFVRPGPAPPEARAPQPRPSPGERFQPGQCVRFSSGGQRYSGTVVRVNRKTCTVETPGGQWRVPFGMLKVARGSVGG